jgi:nucleoside-diphosphate-sugar epimerase
MKVGLLGSTGLIGSELTAELQSLGHEVVRFSRHPERELGLFGYSSLLGAQELSVVVNLIGGHEKNRDNFGQDLKLELDALACEWSRTFNRPYIFISSGAVFGASSGKPFNDTTPHALAPLGDSYTALKLMQEKRHIELREHEMKVSDLRIFSFAGPLFIRKGNYFLSELAKAALDGRKLEISGPDFVRDYVGARELAQAIFALEAGEKPRALNLYSAKPVSKSQILKFFSDEMGLCYNWTLFGESGEEPLEYYCSETSKEINSYSPRKSIEAIAESVKGFSDRPKQ